MKISIFYFLLLFYLSTILATSSLIESTEKKKGLPTVLLNGYGSVCDDGKYDDFIELIYNATEAPIVCFHIGIWRFGSVLNNMSYLAE